jgi:putative FmdB family regulatory protein
MPVYGYKCNYCDSEFELINRIKDHQRVVECHKCGKDAAQVISAPMLVIPSHMSATGISSYESPIDGRLITNQRARREDLARSGCMEYEPGIRQDADRRLIDDDKKLDKAIDETFDREIEKMPTKKRERLDLEMKAGVTAETVRA